MSDDPCCGNCRYWMTNGTESICRRKPPQAWFIAAQPTATGQIPAQTISFFPPMSASGLCGEHRRKESGPVVVSLAGDGSPMR